MCYRALRQICCVSLASIWGGGCAGSGTPPVRELDHFVRATQPIATPQSPPANQQISLASAETSSQSVELVSATDPFRGAKELTAELLIEQVLARNPSLAEMEAAWQAASARYPQVV